MEAFSEVYVRSIEDGGIICSEPLIGLMPEVHLINVVQLTSLFYLWVPFPLGAEWFPMFFLAEVSIRKGTDKKKSTLRYKWLTSLKSFNTERIYSLLFESLQFGGFYCVTQAIIQISYKVT